MRATGESPLRFAAAPGAGVGSWIARRSRLGPDRVALVAEERPITYRELDERVRRVANALRSLGVARGDRVVWLGPNDAAFLELLFGCGLIGAVLAPVNHRLPADEVAWVVADAEPAVVVAHRSIPVPALPPSVRATLLVGSASGGAGATAPDGALDYETLVGAASDAPIDAAVASDDLLLLPHTSGTTGRPKGVMLTHGNVTWNALNFLTSTDYRADDVTIAIAPFFRVGGIGVNVLPILLVGGTVVVTERPDADTVLRLVDRHHATVGFGNPDLLDAVARSDRWATSDLSSLRFVVTGGAPVPDRLLRTFLDRGVPLVQGYGLSEAAPLVLILDPRTALRKPGAAGRPAMWVESRIVDANGRDVEPGASGELLVRGPNVMAGYWRRPDATRAVLSDDGWLRTGDAARMDEEGDLWIVDRVDARFVSAGQEVYPGDVERALMAHPSVRDAGVVGVPEGTVGVPEGTVGDSVPVAYVVPETGAALSEIELTDFARGRLPAHAVPAAVVTVDELPRNPVGKLLRHELRALALRDGVGPRRPSTPAARG